MKWIARSGAASPRCTRRSQARASRMPENRTGVRGLLLAYVQKLYMPFTHKRIQRHGTQRLNTSATQVLTFMMNEHLPSAEILASSCAHFTISTARRASDPSSLCAISPMTRRVQIGGKSAISYGERKGRTRQGRGRQISARSESKHGDWVTAPSPPKQPPLAPRTAAAPPHSNLSPLAPGPIPLKPHAAGPAHRGSPNPLKPPATGPGTKAAQARSHLPPLASSTVAASSRSNLPAQTPRTSVARTLVCDAPGRDGRGHVEG
jgi:hypothetical protein